MATLSSVLGAAALAPEAEEVRVEERAEVVVLLHGLGRTRLSMAPMAWGLERAGYEVVNWGYSSVCCTIEELGEQLEDDLRRWELDGATVHFVGHSLGNLIVRWVLAENPGVRVGRVVMLAPPNQGSHEANRYAPWLGWILKPLADLRTQPDRAASYPPLPAYTEVGVIAGRDDGKVSIPETLVAGMTDHVVVPAAHTFLMLRPDVWRHTLEFLREGHFQRPEVRGAGQFSS